MNVRFCCVEVMTYNSFFVIKHDFVHKLQVPACFYTMKANLKNKNYAHGLGGVELYTTCRNKGLNFMQKMSL